MPEDWERKVLSAPRKELHIAEISYTATIPESFMDQVAQVATITPPAGTIARINRFWISATAPGGTSGSHIFWLNDGDQFEGYVLYCAVEHDAYLWFECLDLEFGTASGNILHQYPTTPEARYLALQNYFFDADNPLIITYENATDVDQTNNVNGAVEYIAEEVYS